MQEPRGHSYWKSSGRSFTNFHWRWHVYTISHRSSIILLLRLHKIHRTDPLIEFGMILNLKNVESDWFNGSFAKELNTEIFQHLQSILVAHENAGFREWRLNKTRKRVRRETLPMGPMYSLSKVIPIPLLIRLGNTTTEYRWVILGVGGIGEVRRKMTRSWT